MKKIILFIFAFFSFSIIVNAGCTYSDEKERNALVSYVYYTYDFNDISKTFTVTVYNLQDNLRVRYEGKVLSVTNKETKISNIKPSVAFKAEIVSNDDCIDKKFRIIKINIPYLNSYYNRSECKGHEELSVCSSKYLDYELTERAFFDLLNPSDERKIDNGEDNKKEENTSILIKIVDFFKSMFVPLIIIIITSLITVLIFRPIYRKTKHGI